MKSDVFKYRGISQKPVQVVFNVFGGYGCSALVGASGGSLRIGSFFAGALLGNYIYHTFAFSTFDDMVTDPVGALAHSAEDVLSGHGTIGSYLAVGGAGLLGYKGYKYASGDATGALEAEEIVEGEGIVLGGEELVEGGVAGVELAEEGLGVAEIFGELGMGLLEIAPFILL